MSVTAYYTSVFVLLYALLSFNVIRLRREHKVSLGDGGQLALQRAIRAHGNFLEYMLPTVILLYFFETGIGANYWFHGVALLFLVGRGIHVVAILSDKSRMPLRVIGMALTFTVLISLSVRILLSAVQI